LDDSREYLITDTSISCVIAVRLIQMSVFVNDVFCVLWSTVDRTVYYVW